MGRAKQPQKTHIITRALTNENIHENMQFERNEKHLILITTNYIEPPKYNYAVEVSFKRRRFKNYIIRGKGGKSFRWRENVKKIVCTKIR